MKGNNRKRSFELETERGAFSMPYSMTEPAPGRDDRLSEVYIDDELGRQAFTYRLASGREGTVHVDQVLDYNREPGYMRDALLYRLTVEAIERVRTGPLSRRELMRRLGTSPAQFYRLLDATNHRKSVDGMLELLAVLGCEVELTVKTKSA